MSESALSDFGFNNSGDLHKRHYGGTSPWIFQTVVPMFHEVDHSG
jgi:hypothetical protein